MGYLFPLMAGLFPCSASSFCPSPPGRGLSGWDWFWVVIAALFDIGHSGAGATQRNQVPGRRPSAT